MGEGRKIMKTVKAHMICHTHWDREWYKTFEEFRVRLVRLIDGLLDIIDKCPEYVSFMLDGQTIALEDYLQIKPENSGRLKKALGSGKIVCGPWYILPDELLVSGESLIRNYMMGEKVMSEMGKMMSIAYLPDSFGHPQQMPQIIKGLGMDTMVFWRGAANFMRKTEFNWMSPHKGSQILCIHMPNGYGNSAKLEQDPAVSNPRLQTMISSLREKSETDHVLLMNGSDHITAQKNIVGIVKAFNESSRDAQIQLSTIDGFIKALKKELPELETYSGELRYGERSMLLGGTLSTRMPIKQNNHIVQKNMEKYLEPILVWERLSGGQADLHGYAAYLWKRILENQPHDSICGCSIDAVHAEMMTRFDKIRRLEAALISDTCKRIAELGEKGSNSSDAQLMIFEPTQDSMPSYIEVDVDLDRVLVQQNDFGKSVIVDYESQIDHPAIPASIKIVDERGTEIEHEILSAQKDYYTDYKDETLPEIYKVNRLKVGLLLPGYDCGFHILNICRMDEAENETTINTEAEFKNIIENSYYTVSFEQDSLKVTDKKTGKVYHGVNRLVDKGDAGDEYTYSWPCNDSVYGLDSREISIEKISTAISQKLIISGTLLLPKKLTDDRQSRSPELLSSQVKITVSLCKDIDRIDFKTDIWNNSCDLRLQAEFPSGVLTTVSRAENCFGITEREIGITIPDTWAEYPQSTHPAHGVISLSDGDDALSAVTLGLTEFEAENTEIGTMLRITLFRSVGWLSRTDLITRKGNGGWTIETPDAQLIGSHSFEYSITYHKANDNGKAYSLLTKHLYPTYIRQVNKNAGNLRLSGNPLAFISNLPWDVRVSALKISERGDSVIFRIYSIAEENRNVSLKLPENITDIYRVNLAEKRLDKPEHKDHSLDFLIEPSEIITFEFLL
jgi:alpha-mannosidase